MVKSAAQAKSISGKPVESDHMPPPPETKALGCGSGKDGRPTISADLIRTREVESTLTESEAALRMTLEEERRRYVAFCFEETARHSLSRTRS